jgi:hypothetical protein
MGCMAWTSDSTAKFLNLQMHERDCSLTLCPLGVSDQQHEHLKQDKLVCWDKLARQLIAHEKPLLQCLIFNLPASRFIQTIES